MSNETFMEVMSRKLRKRDMPEIDGESFVGTVQETPDSRPISGPWSDKSATCADVDLATPSINTVANMVEIQVQSSASSSSSSQCTCTCASQVRSTGESKTETETKSETTQVSERQKMPFSSNGRIVGTRYYGPAIIQGIKKSPIVTVIDEDEPVASSGCILL